MDRFKAGCSRSASSVVGLRSNCFILAAWRTKVLQFEKVADFRVFGDEYGQMEGVFNANMRIVHLRLGEQIVELGIKAIKCQDPGRHDLELLYFPPGKGEPSWQKPTNKLFLGLGHTAMTVWSFPFNGDEWNQNFWPFLKNVGLAGGFFYIASEATMQSLHDAFSLKAR